MKGHPQTNMAGVRAMNAARRAYPRAKLGDVFGERTVTQLLAPDATKNERVEWQCKCGEWGTSYVFNLRNMKPVCTHAAGSRTPRITRHRLTMAERVFTLEADLATVRAELRALVTHLGWVSTSARNPDE